MNFFKGNIVYKDTDPEFKWKWVAILKDNRVISQFDIDETGKGVYHTQDEFDPKLVKEFIITNGIQPTDKVHVIKADKDNQEIKLGINVDIVLSGGKTTQVYNFFIQIKEGDLIQEIPVEALDGS